MIPTWKFSPNSGSSNGENLEKTKQTPIPFPILKVWLGYLLLCEAFGDHPLPLTELAFLCSHSISSHAVFSLAFCEFVSPARLWHWEQRIFPFHLLYSLLRIAFLAPTSSLKSGINRCVLEAFTDSSNLLFLLLCVPTLSYENFYHSVHHTLIIIPYSSFCPWRLWAIWSQKLCPQVMSKGTGPWKDLNNGTVDHI